MAPRHTQGCGGAACLATALFLVQQTKNWCVGFSFPPPAYAGIHPTLYLFGFRANALNSHSPLLCLALIRGLVSDDSGPFFGLCWETIRGVSGGVRGPPGPSGSPAVCEGPPGGPPGACGGLRGRPPRPRSLGLGFLNNLVNHRKGEGVP